MKAVIAKLREAVALPGDDDAQDPARSSYERFAVPYAFKPRLSVLEAAIAAGGAFLRIFLGSILFGFCGAYTIQALQAIMSPFWRAALLLAMLFLFTVLLLFLLFAISAAERKLWPQNGADIRKSGDSK